MNRIIILSFVILFGCSSAENKDIIGDNEIIVPSEENNRLEGLWALPNYIDSILINKSIANYRIQEATWFAILIDIEKDSLRTYGSILDIQKSYNSKNDTLCIFEKTVSGDWILLYNPISQKIELKSSSLDKEVSQRFYEFEKRSDLEFLIKNQDAIHKTSTNFTNYFHKELFVGTYELIGQQAPIIFEPNGEIKGFENYKKYEVDNYFGTSHPYNNMDNIVFYKDSSDNNDFDLEIYSWKFHADTLVLNQLIWNQVTNETGQVQDEFWEPSKTKVSLKRK